MPNIDSEITKSNLKVIEKVKMRRIMKSPAIVKLKLHVQ